jgi:hypothetical protein
MLAPESLMKAETRTDSERKSPVIRLVGQLPTRKKMNFGGALKNQTALVKVRILGDNCETMLLGK